MKSKLVKGLRVWLCKRNSEGGWFSNEKSTSNSICTKLFLRKVSTFIPRKWGNRWNDSRIYDLPSFDLFRLKYPLPRLAVPTVLRTVFWKVVIKFLNRRHHGTEQSKSWAICDATPLGSLTLSLTLPKATGVSRHDYPTQLLACYLLRDPILMTTI